MTWASPIYLYLLIPVIALYFFLLWKNSYRPYWGFSSLQEAGKSLQRSWQIWLLNCRHLLSLITLVCILLALARPQTPQAPKKQETEGIDIMIVLDISDSMLIEDMPPHRDRLEAAKATIKTFVEKRDSDQVGLIVFSGESYTRVPLTLDHEWFLDNLKNVSAHLAVEEGTAIGVSLLNGVIRLKNSEAKAKVLIFLTDGESNRGSVSPETALQYATEYGLKIYSIGLGVDGEARIPIYRNINGKKVKHYFPIHSKINVELLKKMATTTGGKFYRVTPNFSIDEVFADINKLETYPIETRSLKTYKEESFWYIVGALIGFTLNLLLSFVIVRVYP